MAESQPQGNAPRTLVIAGRTFTEVATGVWHYDAPSGWLFIWHDASSGRHPRADACRPLTELQLSYSFEESGGLPPIRQAFAGMRVRDIDEAAALFLRFKHGEF